MPESKVRKDAAAKKKAKVATDANVEDTTDKNVEDVDTSVEDTTDEVAAGRPRRAKVVAPGSRRWVPPTFITVGLLGVAWLVTYYIAGRDVPMMNKLGDWNILIGMGLMAASFGIATLWT